MKASDKDADGFLLLKGVRSNFHEQEFFCPCGKCHFSQHVTVAVELVERLEFLRSAFQRPVVVISGARCVDHNRAVGGAPHSNHVPADDGLVIAADIVAHDVYPLEFYSMFRGRFPLDGGAGLYSASFHLDCRGIRMEWVHHGGKPITPSSPFAIIRWAASHLRFPD